mgnify:CR=1 FL=1
MKELDNFLGEYLLGFLGVQYCTVLERELRGVEGEAVHNESRVIPL